MSLAIKRILCSVILSALSMSAMADVTYVIKGVDDELRTNILAHNDQIQLGPQVRLSARDLPKVLAKAEANTRQALRPFGYYAPEVTSTVVSHEGDDAVVEINVVPGPPVRIEDVRLEVTGAGENARRFVDWQRQWPLRIGGVLNQQVWESQKQEVMDLAHSRGFLSARFAEHELRIDLLQNTAGLTLVLDTGPRYVMGDIDFGDHGLRAGILEYLPRFEKGDYYTSQLVHWFRTDIWKTGYFEDVLVEEVPRSETEPPRVDLKVNVESGARNRYQGAVGWGTDTGVRLQTNWTRVPMSRNGDRLDIGIGWRHLDEQFRLRGAYRVPRRDRAREYWTSELTLNFENTDLEVKRNPDDENFVKLAAGDVNEQHLRVGRLKIRNFQSGEQQSFETFFLQQIYTTRDYEFVDSLVASAPDSQGLESLLGGTDSAFSFGFDWDYVAVEGRSFKATGHRERAWVFHSSKDLGSEVDFTQLYFSTRRSYLAGDRFKFHLRGEVGYTEADVFRLPLDNSEPPLELSVTQLPNFYRFKAGGSMSVRGYGFEQLSDNNIGSNNIITASAEVEYRFLNSWSAALFYDIGNAFNDWDEPDLKRGAGIGIRWYSFAGEVRLDVAQALDFNGQPWRVHITIGTPLL
jgi:translocation and assembly module TamA